MKRLLFGLFLIIIIFLALYGYKKYNERAPDLTSAHATATLTADSLIHAFETNPATATKNYVDKVVAVTGTVKSMSTEGSAVLIFLGSGNGMSSVKCSMDSAHAAQYKAVVKNNLITVKGTCKGFQSDELLGTDVELNRCVLQKN